MRVLVVYGTKSGCTKGVAEKIGETLGARGADVTVVSAGEAPVPQGFDAVVVGSGVRAGAWHQAPRSWVTSQASALKQVPVAVFTCGMTLTQGAEKAPEMRAYTDTLLTETGVKPVDIGVFAVWYEPKSFSLPERAIMKLMKTPQGDFRDWDAIAGWAGDVAPKLGLT